MKLSTTERVKDGKASFATNIALPLGGIVALITFTLTFFTKLAPSGNTDLPIDVYCTPDGHPHALERDSSQKYNQNYNQVWDPSLFLSITLGLGDFNYVTARAIDVCWDFVVGRGGQIALIILARPVIVRSLRCQMEKASVHFRTFASVAFDTVSLSALFTTLRDFIGRRNSSAKADLTHNRSYTWNWRYFGHLLVLLYILVFNTQVTTMTGYQAKYDTMVTRPDNGVLINRKALETPQLVIVDGHRIGLDDNQPIYIHDPRLFILTSYAETADKYIGKCYHPSYDPSDNNATQPCVPSTGWDTTGGNEWLVSTCSFTCVQPGNTSSTIAIDGTTWSLKAPPLNIAPQSRLFGSYAPGGLRYLSYGNLTFNSTYLQQNTMCQPTDHYQWGFSSILLLVFCLSSTMFAVVLAMLHYYAFLNSKADRYKLDTNQYRDAVDLVYQLRDEHFGESIRNMSASELKHEIEMEDKGTSLDVSKLGISRKEALVGLIWGHNIK